MKNNLVKFLSIGVLALMMFSCKTATPDPETLPKDIAERPVDEDSRKYAEAQLEQLRSIIDNEIAKEKCTDGKQWDFAPVGAKACGGPVSYIAYPKSMEASILPKLENFKAKMMAYNKKYSITSDCMLPVEPVSVRCQAGKAVLVYP